MQVLADAALFARRALEHLSLEPTAIGQVGDDPGERAATVADFMTTPVVTVTTRTPVRRAAALMKGRSIGSLVVTSANGKLAGIVTVADLLDQVARKPVRATNRAMRKALAESGWEDE